MHGDIQAVFDAEPPRSVEDETANNDDLHHPTFEDEFTHQFGRDIEGERRKKIAPKDRRDSVAPFAGLPQRLRDLVDTESEDEYVKNRLEALEKSTLRIEGLLGRLCADLDAGLGKRREGDAED